VRGSPGPDLAVRRRVSLCPRSRPGRAGTRSAGPAAPSSRC